MSARVGREVGLGGGALARVGAPSGRSSGDNLREPVSWTTILFLASVRNCSSFHGDNLGLSHRRILCPSLSLWPDTHLVTVRNHLDDSCHLDWHRLCITYVHDDEATAYEGNSGPPGSARR